MVEIEISVTFGWAHERQKSIPKKKPKKDDEPPLKRPDSADYSSSMKDLRAKIKTEEEKEKFRIY